MPATGLLVRIGELVKEKGSRWKEIAEVIQAEGYVDDDGRPFTSNAIRKRWKRQKEDRPIIPVKTVKGIHISPKSRPTLLSDVSDKGASKIDLNEIKNFLEDQTLTMKRELQEFVKEQVKDLAPASADTPLPQQPGYRKAAPIGERDDTGRGYTDEWRRVKLAGTVHHKLESMFQAERKGREFSVSRMLDTVLWHYFGCPPLGDEEPRT